MSGAGAGGALVRLERLYERLEGLRRAELGRAAAMVAQAHDELAGVRVQAEACRAAARSASAGLEPDRVEMLLAESAGEFAEMHTELWLGYAARARDAEVAAGEQYRRARLEREQMLRLIELARERAATELGRREQAAADDRFAARSNWRAGQPR